MSPLVVRPRSLAEASSFGFLRASTRMGSARDNGTLPLTKSRTRESCRSPQSSPAGFALRFPGVLPNPRAQERERQIQYGARPGLPRSRARPRACRAHGRRGRRVRRQAAAARRAPLRSARRGSAALGTALPSGDRARVRTRQRAPSCSLVLLCSGLRRAPRTSASRRASARALDRAGRPSPCCR